MTAGRRLARVRVADRQYPTCVDGTAVTGHGESTTREEDLDDGAVEELLFGWFEGKAASEMDSACCAVFLVLTPPSYFFKPIIFISRYLLPNHY